MYMYESLSSQIILFLPINTNSFHFILESMRRAGEMMDVRYRKMNKLFMSGDISFSYPYDKAAVKKLADEKFYKTLDPLKGTEWALIFSRENNFGIGKGKKTQIKQ